MIEVTKEVYDIITRGQECFFYHNSTDRAFFQNNKCIAFRRGAKHYVEAEHLLKCIQVNRIVNI